MDSLSACGAGLDWRGIRVSGVPGRARRPRPVEAKAGKVLVIIGAARSGTKLLRDLLATHPSVACVPYDINFVWNESLVEDELDTVSLTRTREKRIHRQIARFQGSSSVLVEKTVANCLRVPFVHAALPDAKFVHLIRDGRDVVESAKRQWTAPPSWRYTFAKARTFPTLAVRRYGVQYATRLLGGFVRPSGPPPTWGPRYRGIDDDLARLGLLETVARQWAVSVERALVGLSTLPAAQVRTLRYEDLVAAPEAYLQDLWSFVGVESLDPVDLPVNVDHTHVGQHRALSDEELCAAMPYLRGPLTRLGYLPSTGDRESPPRA